MAARHHHHCQTAQRYFGLVAWYQVYIPKFAEMAAPLIDALKGKYQYAPPEAADENTDTNVPKKHKHIKLSAKEARIHWSDEMKKIFEGLEKRIKSCYRFVTAQTWEALAHTL